MTGHTPGPWAVNEDGWKVESKNEHGWINDGWIVCSTHGPDAEHNSRLIAAAPELLEALKSALSQLEQYEADRTGETYNDLQINDAIAKAERKS